MTGSKMICKSTIEATKVEKYGSDNKVKPKFKVDDCIVYDNNVYHIINIGLNSYYECLRIDGTVHTFNFGIDDKSHLCTSESVKDWMVKKNMLN